MTNKFICIVCPNGCHLEVEKDGDNLTVRGNKCPRGKAFALEELTAPKRSVTTTVATVFPYLPVVPVRTRGEIPKDKVTDLIKHVNTLTVDKLYKTGEILERDVLDTGIDLIITTDMTLIAEENGNV